MINRVLIRIKVVQILYSYLLSRSEFKIESAPETTSKDKRYAYSLYLDLLLLILELSGVKVQGGHKALPVPESALNKHLTENRVIRSLAVDDEIRNLILRESSSIAEYNEAAVKLYDSIITSAAYRSFIRLKERDLKTDVDFWVTILHTIIAKSPEVLEVARRNPDFATVGFNRAFEMVTSTLTDYTDTRLLLTQARNALDHSLTQANELYCSLLMLPVTLTRFHESRIDAARNKYLPSQEDLNPNMKLLDNSFVSVLGDNKHLQEFLKDNPQPLLEDDVMLRGLLDKILASDIYASYTASDVSDWAGDCEFWRSVMKNIVLPSDDLAEALENQSIYWNDDLQIMGTFTLKTIKQFASSDEGKGVKLLPKFKDREDEKFGPLLFVKAIEHREEYRAYIDRFVNARQWDSDRLAFMDFVIMLCAITEVMNFPSIPVNVTLNEYIEIAHYYSTPKSGQFINGILYSVIKALKEEGKLLKEFEFKPGDK